MDDGPDWDGAAAYWDEMMGEDGDYFQQYIIHPAVQDAVAVEGRTVLDAACGNGHLSRELARAGADVTGIDVSPAMIERARDHPAPGDLEYQHHDLHEPVEGEYDIVVCNTAIQDIADHHTVLENLQDALAPSGTFIMTTRHPCFAPTDSDHGWQLRDTDGRKGLSHLRPGDPVDAERFTVGDYLGGGSFDREWPDGATTTSHGRTLEEYVTALHDAGFVLTRLREPTPTEAGHEAWPDMAELLEQVPHFILFMAESA